MVGKIISDVVSLLGRRHRERRIRNELDALSDEDLAELRLARTDIQQVARQATRKC
jgi:uncharacterized protein YjiS (DUF1127 family)